MPTAADIQEFFEFVDWPLPEGPRLRRVELLMTRRILAELEGDAVVTRGGRRISLRAFLEERRDLLAEP
jgi:hypothetical protein